jgi:hypothetical protein
MFALLSTAVRANEWQPVQGSMLHGVSGMALVSQSVDERRLLIVHDNKKRGEPRFAMISLRSQEPVQYTPLTWDWDDDQVDMESLSRVPEETSTFVAMSSRGAAFYIRLNESAKRVDTILKFKVPEANDQSNFEGLCVQKIDKKLVMIWGHRGQDDLAGALFWSEVDLQKGRLTRPKWEKVKMSLPGKGIRHISELKVDETGSLIVSSSGDQGDDGPFQSAVYLTGVFSSKDGEVSLKLSSAPTRLYSFRDHKVEGFELMPNGGIIFGTDDENYGGWVYAVR